MIISLDLQSDVPIYIQLKNKIIEGIASKQLKLGEALPSVRVFAQDLGVNMHTVNKAYQLLKQDGYIQIHRQKGVVINPDGMPPQDADFRVKLQEQLRPLISESICRGMSMEQITNLCKEIYNDILSGGNEDDLR
ncbi:GntR family transcriptional regulator [Bacillus andreraoultii]|uniref:GntR family transcriptional regulator n=1 Tax=Bacillus andreraoultii TaxID=1499685 RepID=UPI00053BA321|nr:GntR family transcriptional regulator [Bacillus andreraoultii]